MRVECAEERRAVIRAAGQLSIFPLIFGAEFFKLCPHRHKPALEDIDDLVANLGRREGSSVYQPTPTIDLILSADDNFIGVAIHGDEALGFLNLLHQIIDGHDLRLHWRRSDRDFWPLKSGKLPFPARPFSRSRKGPS